MSGRPPPPHRPERIAVDNNHQTNIFAQPPHPIISPTPPTPPTPLQLQQARRAEPNSIDSSVFSCHRLHSNTFKGRHTCGSLRDFTIRGQSLRSLFRYNNLWFNIQGGLDAIGGLAPRQNANGISRIVKIICHDPVKPAVWYFVEDLKREGHLRRVYCEDGHSLQHLDLAVLGCSLVKCKVHNTTWEISVMG